MFELGSNRKFQMRKATKYFPLKVIKQLKSDIRVQEYFILFKYNYRNFHYIVHEIRFPIYK